MSIVKKRNQLSSLNREKIEEESLDSALRPKNWEEYVGQEKVKKNLKIILEAAKQRGEAPEHLLFYGNAGLGKTTLSYLIAKELGVNIKITAGPVLERPGDLAAILTNLEENNILFIDECHRISKILEEYLYPAMEDFKLNIILGKGPMAKTMELKLPRFTLIGATTRVALLSSPLRNRFGAIFQLDFYSPTELEKILQHSAKILKIEVLPEALRIISSRSRFTPRVANRLLKRVRDFAQVEGKGIIDEKIALKALGFLEIDELGLEPADRKILETLIRKFDGGPAGLQALAAATFEEEDAILEIYETYLMQLGLIERTPRGRVATKLAYEYLKIKSKKSQQSLIF